MKEISGEAVVMEKVRKIRVKRKNWQDCDQLYKG